MLEQVPADRLTAFAAVASAAAACLALTTTVIVAVYTVKKQISAAVISPSRREWIVTLRGHLSELLSIIFSLTQHFRLREPIALERVERFIYLESQVRLMINPNEKDHAKLTKLIRDAALELTRDDPGHADRLTELSERIVVEAQPILKREWVRVKEGA
jgi:hypothetical protein